MYTKWERESARERCCVPTKLSLTFLEKYRDWFTEKLVGFFGKQRGLGLKLFLWLAFLYDLYIPFFSLQVSVAQHPPPLFCNILFFPLQKVSLHALGRYFNHTELAHLDLSLYHSFGSTNGLLKLWSYPCLILCLDG